MAKKKSGPNKSAPATATAAPAEKRSATGGDKPSASAFIRSLPITMPVSAVVKEGAAKGYSFSPTLVYMVRKPKDGAQKAAKPGRTSATPVAKKSGPNKSDFVRSQPFDLPAAAVVAKAKEAGLTLTSALVYKVRGKQTSKTAPRKKAASDQSPAAAPVRAPVATPAKARLAGDKETAASRMFNVEMAIQKILADSIAAAANQIAHAVRHGLAAEILGTSAPAASATPSPAASVAKAGKATRRSGKRHPITQAELDSVLAVIAKEPGLTSVQLQKAAGIDGKQAARVLSKLRETKKVNLNGSRSKATYTVA